MTVSERIAWRTYAAAAIMGVAATVSHDDIYTACHIAAEIADRMVIEEKERLESEE